MDRLCCTKDFEVEALATLDRNSRDYYKSGADGEQTLEDNIKDFQRLETKHDDDFLMTPSPTRVTDSE